MPKVSTGTVSLRPIAIDRLRSRSSRTPTDHLAHAVNRQASPPNLDYPTSFPHPIVETPRDSPLRYMSPPRRSPPS